MNRNLLHVADKSTLPSDSVSCVRWMDKGNQIFFMVSSWDGTLRVYQVESNLFKQVFIHETEYPITAFDVNAEKGKVVYSNLTGQVNMLDLQSKSEVMIHNHGVPIRSLYLIETSQSAIAFDADKIIKGIEMRERGGTWDYGFKYTTSAVSFAAPMFAVGFMQSFFTVFQVNELRTGHPPYFPNPLNSPCSAIQLSKDGSEVTIATLDGRICRMLLPSRQNNNVKSDLAFKAHKKDIEHANDIGILFQINSIDFIYRPGSFYCISGGGDGMFFIWDIINRYRCGFLNMGSPVVEVKAHPIQPLVIVCTGYDWSQGIWGLETIPYTPSIAVYVLSNKDFENSNTDRM